MAGNRGVYADSPQPYHGGDPNRDLATVLSVPQQLMQDLAGGANLVISGFTLSVLSGMQVQVAAGICWANGLRAATVSTPLTINTTSTQPRYTIIRVTVMPNNPVGTDGTTGNNLIADTNAVDFVDGTPGATPIKPTLASAYQVQVGSILLPAGTSTLTSGMLNTLDCAPNSQGPDGAELVSSFTHRQTNITSSASAHGIKQGSGNAFDADTVDGQHASAFQPAGSYDAAGAAATVAGNLTTESTTRASADTVLTNALNAHEGQSIYTGITHGEESRRGHVTGISITGGMGQVQVATITFSPAMAGTPQCITLTMDQPNPGGAPPYAQSPSSTGFQIWMSTAGTYNGGVYWRADS